MDMLHKIIDGTDEFFSLAGRFLNSLVTFAVQLLGNTGKLLSTAVILFTMYLIWVAFSNQIINVEPLPVLKDPAHPEQLATALQHRATVYQNAIQSVAGPLATLAGVIPVIIGMGMIFQKYTEHKENIANIVNGGNVTTDPTPPQQQPSMPMPQVTGTTQYTTTLPSGQTVQTNATTIKYD